MWIIERIRAAFRKAPAPRSMLSGSRTYNTLEAQIIRADGTVEDLGVIARSGGDA